MARVRSQKKSLVEQCDEVVPHLFWAESDFDANVVYGFANAGGSGCAICVTAMDDDTVAVTYVADAEQFPDEEITLESERIPRRESDLYQQRLKNIIDKSLALIHEQAYKTLELTKRGAGLV